MGLTLENFYKTKMWQDFRELVIQERTDKRGYVVCDYCGKAIFNRITCHHIEELTEANVNDFNISLNPKNISCVHGDCHNKIHERFSKDKKVYLVWGPPLSYMDYLEKNVGKNDFIISIDFIYKALNTQSFLSLHNPSITTVAHDLMDHMLEQWIDRRRGSWSNCYIVGTYPSKVRRDGLVKQYGIDEVIYCEMTKEECYYNAQRRQAPSYYYKYIDKWFEDVVV